MSYEKPFITYAVSLHFTQDVNEIQKENFVDYLNYERDRRKQIRENGNEDEQ